MLASVQHWAFWEIFSSRVFWCGLGGWMVASTIKMAIAAWKTHQFDFATVRRAAGEHARVLNAIVRDIKELKFKPKERFRELLGHTRTEVIWGMVTGILWATLVCAVF